MAKKKTKTERRVSAIKGWKTRRKKGHRTTRLSISKASTQKGAVKKPARRKTKSAGKTTPKRRARTVKRTTKTTKKKKTKKSTRAVSKRKLTKRIRKKKTKTKKPKGVTPGTRADKFYLKSNRTYFVTVKLASGKHERKRPLNVIVWARDGLKDQKVIELLWTMIKRRQDKNLMFALDMEVKELIVAHGPLTDRLQGYRLN